MNGIDIAPLRLSFPTPSAAVRRLRERARRGPVPVQLGWFHRYPARFASEVVGTMIAGAVRRLEGPLSLCLDPFAGTGATNAAFRMLGIPSVGVELSELGVAIAALRLDPPTDLSDAYETLVNWTRACSTRRHRSVDDELEWWIGTDNARIVTRLRDRIEDCADPALKRFATVAVSQALRPSSRWLVGSVKVTADANREPQPIGPQIGRWATVIARDCARERARTPLVSGEVPPAQVLVGDGCDLPLSDASVDVVITSPPYFVTYDYFEVNRLSFLAFGWPRPAHLQVGVRFGVPADGIGFVPPRPMRDWYEERFGAESTVFGRALRAYFQRLEANVKEIRRVLRPGGVAAYAVANSTRQGQTFDLVGATREILERNGLTRIRSVPRGLGSTHTLPVYRNAKSGRFSSRRGISGVSERILYACR